MSVIPTIRRKREGGMGKRDPVSLRNKTDKNQSDTTDWLRPFSQVSMNNTILEKRINLEELAPL